MNAAVDRARGRGILHAARVNVVLILLGYLKDSNAAAHSVDADIS